MNRVELYLVAAEGKPVDPAYEQAVKKAFIWTVRQFPKVDASQIADWAEEVFRSMQHSDAVIERPVSYANVVLRGKVLSWKRLVASNVEYVGVGRDLERIGGKSSSFEGTLERNILFDQVGLSLDERDRYILTLLREDRSTTEIATAVKISDAAARKAIQRVKERMATILLGDEERVRPALVCEAKG